jgi:hypothetical protein
MSTKDEVMAELGRIKEEEHARSGADVIERTVSHLLSIEKKSMYGSVRGKGKLMEDVIIREIANYRESKQRAS